MRAKIKYSLMSLLFLLQISCGEKKEAKTNSQLEKIEWAEINIYLDNQEIIIHNKTDSALFFQWDYRDRRLLS